MIGINLLPPEFRVQKRQTSVQRIPIKKLGLGGGILLILLTFIFYIDYMIVSHKNDKLQKDWQTIQPQAVVLNQLRFQVEGQLKPEKEFIERFITSSRPLTYIMMWVTEFLPETIWLTEFKLDQDAKGTHMILKGLCLPSKAKGSIEEIEAYLQQVKAKMPDAGFNLTTNRELIQHVQLTEFTAAFDWQNASVATGSPAAAPGVKK